MGNQSDQVGKRRSVNMTNILERGLGSCLGWALISLVSAAGVVVTGLLFSGNLFNWLNESITVSRFVFLVLAVMALLGIAAAADRVHKLRKAFDNSGLSSEVEEKLYTQMRHTILEGHSGNPMDYYTDMYDYKLALARSVDNWVGHVLPNTSEVEKQRLISFRDEVVSTPIEAANLDNYEGWLTLAENLRFNKGE